MAGMGIIIKVIHGERLQHKLEPKAMLGPGLHSIWSKAGLLLQRKLMEYSPVDTGRLKSSFTYQLDKGTIPMFVEVGTNVEYASFVEFGKGRPRGVGRIPFFRPAVKDLRGKLNAVINDALKTIGANWSRD